VVCQCHTQGLPALLLVQSFFGVKKGPAEPAGGSADGTPVAVAHLSRGRSMDVSSQGAGTSGQGACLPEVDLKRKRELVSCGTGFRSK
jgi:hypothetical protein